jgi:hypothetical protein
MIGEDTPREPALTDAELLTALAMREGSPMIVAVAVAGAGTWPSATVDTARRIVRREHMERLAGEPAV